MGKLRERKWPSVIITPITVSGDKIIVSDSRGLHPKQQITLYKTGLEPLALEVKRVLDPQTIQVGPTPQDNNGAKKQAGRGVGIDSIQSVPVTYSGGSLEAAEQARTSISSEAVWPAVYSEEPTVAIRTIPVNYFGTPLEQPEAQIEQLEPVTRFIYSANFDILYIREWAPNATIGDPLKVTRFRYGPSLELLAINTYNDTVQPADLAAIA